MEDTKIIALYWDRSEEAITETAAKYGGFCHSIAYNILSSYTPLLSPYFLTKMNNSGEIWKKDGIFANFSLFY